MEHKVKIALWVLWTIKFHIGLFRITLTSPHPITVPVFTKEDQRALWLAQDSQLTVSWVVLRLLESQQERK